MHKAQSTMHNAQLAIDAGWIACGEKLNRSLCSLKIKLFLDAGGVDCGLFKARSIMHDAQFCRLAPEIGALRTKILCYKF